MINILVLNKDLDNVIESLNNSLIEYKIIDEVQDVHVIILIKDLEEAELPENIRGAYTVLKRICG